MKNRASLVLMEQLVLILIFALAATLCMQAFVGADRISRETGLRDEAVLLAQNGAEAIKGSEGDLEQAAALLGGICEGSTLTLRQDRLCMQITPTPGEIPGLGLARIHVTETDSNKVLFSLTVGWQEVG